MPSWPPGSRCGRQRRLSRARLAREPAISSKRRGRPANARTPHGQQRIPLKSKPPPAGLVRAFGRFSTALRVYQGVAVTTPASPASHTRGYTKQCYTNLYKCSRLYTIRTFQRLLRPTRSGWRPNTPRSAAPVTAALISPLRDCRMFDTFASDAVDELDDDRPEAVRSVQPREMAGFGNDRKLREAFR